MASIPFVVLAAIILPLFYSPQVIAATCSQIGKYPVCDDYCNEVGDCSSIGVFTSTTNCQALSKICLNNTCTSVSSPSYCEQGVRDQVLCLNTQGKVPSLTDCSTYHDCNITNPYAEPTKCVGSSFNPLTRECGGGLPGGQCTNFTPTRCTFGMKGTPPTTDKLGYECVGTSTVRWTVCEVGGHFSKRTGTCIYTGSSADSLCPTSTPGTFPNGSTSCSYIRCYGLNDFELIQCVKGFRYSQPDGGCIYGACI